MENAECYIRDNGTIEESNNQSLGRWAGDDLPAGCGGAKAFAQKDGVGLGMSSRQSK